MSRSDYIALAAVAVALLAALYARRAAGEAKRANDISLHVHKVEIYEEVISFSDCFRGLFNVPTAARLEAFKKRQCNARKFIFPKTYTFNCKKSTHIVVRVKSG